MKTVRRIMKGDKNLVVSIRTTQDHWIAFTRKADDTGWKTLDDVDVVVASAVDNRDMPTAAVVHMLDKADLCKRFDEAYKARQSADHSIKVGIGVWIALYGGANLATPDSVASIGAGAGDIEPPIARVPLMLPQDTSIKAPDDPAVGQSNFTIADAKRRLAQSLGVKPETIRITIRDV